MINGFFGQYRFLSNFWLAKVSLDGVEYPSVEHAYQAAKLERNDMRDWIREAATPADAKRIAKRVPLRASWEKEREAIMRDLVTQKFQDGEMRRLLLETGDQILVEGNTWGDTYWGVCRGQGENRLGKILMDVRNHLRSVS